MKGKVSKLCFLLGVIFIPICSIAQVSIESIVLDAGHGGHDSGAKGVKHYEKDIALEITKKVGEMINVNHPHISVIYTREDDTFIPLFQRIGLANKRNADVFVSIHCNSSPRKEVKGSETYVMGLHRADENLAVAQRENEVILLENDYEENYDGFDPQSPVGHIILSSFQNAYLSASLDIAASIEKGFKSRNFTTSRGVKQAGFAVLRRATMPAVLVETGFISNKDEEAYLGSEKGQNEIAQAIYQSLVANFSKDKKVTTVIVEPQNHKNNNAKEGVTQVSSTGGTTISNKVYEVQFTAVTKPLNNEMQEAASKIGKVIVMEQNGFHKYRITNLRNEKEANDAQKALQKIGYKGAYIIRPSM